MALLCTHLCSDTEPESDPGGRAAPQGNPMVHYISRGIETLTKGEGLE
jgi:hypothetical protein